MTPNTALTHSLTHAHTEAIRVETTAAIALYCAHSLTHSLACSLTHSLTQTSGGETGVEAAQADAATTLLAISTNAPPNPIPNKVIQAHQLVTTDALLCLEWSFQEWQDVDSLLWPSLFRNALLNYSSYVRCLMEVSGLEDPLLRFNEATKYIHNSRVKTFSNHIEEALLQMGTTSVIEKKGAAKFFVCALAALTYQAPLAFPPHRLNDC